MIRKMLACTAAIAALAAANPAAAGIYKYNLSNGGTLTIDTTLMKGSLIASDINATFSGAGLASFAGGFNIPTFGTNISIDPTSWRIVNGVTYVPNANHQQMLETGNYPGMWGAGTNQINLWSYWGTLACPTCNILGDYLATAVSTSTSTGGTSVPEPGMAGLLALGVAGMAFARRRRAKVTVGYKMAAA